MMEIVVDKNKVKKNERKTFFPFPFSFIPPMLTVSYKFLIVPGSIATTKKYYDGWEIKKVPFLMEMENYYG